MLKAIVPFYSGSGHTRKLAHFVHQGLETLGSVEATLFDVAEAPSDVDWEVFHEADILVFGSPTYMGSLAGPFKSFLDKTGRFWLDQKWGDKIAAGFTIGGNASGDKLNSLVQISICAAQHGMIWVGQNQLGSMYTSDGQDLNAWGSWLGLMAKSDPDKTKLISEGDARTAVLFGQRVAQAAARWYSQTV